MGKDSGLEELRQLFKDQRQYSAVGMVTKLGVLSDRSALRVQVKLFPDEREIIATMTWDCVGPNAGDFTFPVPEDLVLVQMVDGDIDQAYVIKRLTSKVDQIPAAALLGHQVRQALAGKKTYLASDTRIVLGLPDSEGVEPLVLGTTLQTMLTAILAQLSTQADAQATQATAIGTMATKLQTMATDLSTHVHPTAAPGPASPPVTAAAYVTAAADMATAKSAMDTAKSALDTAKGTYDDQKASPVDDGAILSDLAYTEKGGA